jgi:hypothetical protein
VFVLSGEKKRAQKALPKNRRRSPLVPVVGSPGVNLMLSQASPKTIGVKRASSTPSQTPSKFPFLFFLLTIICSKLWEHCFISVVYTQNFPFLHLVTQPTVKNFQCVWPHYSTLSYLSLIVQMY